MSKLDILNEFTPEEIIQHFKRKGQTALIANGVYDCSVKQDFITNLFENGNIVTEKKMKRYVVELTEVLNPFEEDKRFPNFDKDKLRTRGLIMEDDK